MANGILTPEQLEAVLAQLPEVDLQELEDAQKAREENWERLGESPRWNFRESKLPSCQYFLRYDGPYLKKFDIFAKLIAKHEELHPSINEVRMIFKPNGEKKFDHSIEVEGLRQAIDNALEAERVAWRLRELYRFNNDGFHYIFRAGGAGSENWVNHGIILVFSPFGVIDI